MGVFHLQKISENFYWEFWEFPFGKRAFHLAPLHHFTKNCSAIFSNTSLFVAFPSNKWLLSACVVMRSLTSACSRRSSTVAHKGHYIKKVNRILNTATYTNKKGCCK